MSQSFQEAVAEFRRFLAQNGYQQEVVWVKPDDVILTGGPLLYVRVPAPRSNEEPARQLFECGIARQKGVLFGTLCEIDGATCSYAWVPKDEAESQKALMPTGLKMSVHSEDSRVQGKAVLNSLHWSYLRLKYRKKQESKKQLFQ